MSGQASSIMLISQDGFVCCMFAMQCVGKSKAVFKTLLRMLIHVETAKKHPTHLTVSLLLTSGVSFRSLRKGQSDVPKHDGKGRTTFRCITEKAERGSEPWRKGPNDVPTHCGKGWTTFRCITEKAKRRSEPSRKGSSDVQKNGGKGRVTFRVITEMAERCPVDRIAW